MKTELHQDALNDAGWKLLDELQKLMDVVPNRVFNNLKPALAAAIEVYQIKATSPAQWNGDGLPPVGLEVEVLWSSISKSYVTGLILAHDEGRAVFRFTSGERKGEYQADKSHFSSEPLLPNFRPIRTAEQIAAEEREKGVEEMLNHSPVGRSAFAKDFCETLYNAGARMPGEGSKV